MFLNKSNSILRLNTVFFLISIIAWFILSVARTGYNFSKFFTEDLKLVTMSDYQKREMVLGDLYDFLIFVNKKLPSKSEFLFFSSNPDVRYLGIYFLYHGIQEYVELGNNNLSKTNNFSYIVLYDDRKKRTVVKKEFDGYTLVSSYRSSSVLGWIYKKNE